jgi:hypothetical protein
MSACFQVIMVIAAIGGAAVWWTQFSRARRRRRNPAAYAVETLDAARGALIALQTELISNTVIVALEQLQGAINEFEQRRRQRLRILRGE